MYLPSKKKSIFFLRMRCNHCRINNNHRVEKKKKKERFRMIFDRVGVRVVCDRGLTRSRWKKKTKKSRDATGVVFISNHDAVASFALSKTVLFFFSLFIWKRDFAGITAVIAAGATKSTKTLRRHNFIRSRANRRQDKTPRASSRIKGPFHFSSVLSAYKYSRIFFIYFF